VDRRVAIVRWVHLQVIGVMQSLVGPYIDRATALEDAGRVQVVCELPMVPIHNFSNMRRRFLALTLGGSLAADSLQHHFGDPFPGMLVCSMALAPFLCGILRRHLAPHRLYTSCLCRHGDKTVSREHQGRRSPHRPTIGC
jgi:hypothetical protein